MREVTHARHLLLPGLFMHAGKDFRFEILESHAGLTIIGSKVGQEHKTVNRKIRLEDIWDDSYRAKFLPLVNEIKRELGDAPDAG